MTDNRMNEPTEAQIQIFDQIDMPEYNPSANSGRGDWGLRNVSDGTVMTHPTDIVRCVEHGAMNSVSPNRAIWRCLMCGRSAYRDIAGDAALVAAQGAAPQEPRDVDPRHTDAHDSWDAGGYCNALVVDENGDGDICNYRQPLPVLPSSGVDEGALAEVIAHSGTAWEREWSDCLDGKADDPGPSFEYIARAVAEWLKGQGR